MFGKFVELTLNSNEPYALSEQRYIKNSPLGGRGAIFYGSKTLDIIGWHKLPNSQTDSYTTVVEVCLEFWLPQLAKHAQFRAKGRQGK